MTLRRLLLTLLSIVLGILAFPPFHWHLLGLVAMIPLLWALRDATPAQATLFGLLYGFSLHRAHPWTAHREFSGDAEAAQHKLKSRHLAPQSNRRFALGLIQPGKLVDAF